MGLSIESDELFGDGLGETKAYTPADGEATTITCVVIRESMGQVEDAYGGRTAARVLEVLLDASTLTPAEGDLLTHNSQSWYLDAVKDHAGGLCLAVFVRHASNERARPGYRR